MNPRPRDLVIRGAYVVTMDDCTGDLPCGDVHISDGRIAAVGMDLPVVDADVLDGRGRVLIPGLIDAHTHLWSSQMRSHFGSSPETAYFRVRNRLADHYTPHDTYHGTRLGAAESVCSGITTLVDFFHNNRGPEHVAACLQALMETGPRCRFLYGPSTRSTPTQAIDIAALEALHASWPRLIDDAPLTLGLAWRGPLGITSLEDEGLTAQESPVAREEIEAARRLGLPIAIHVSGHRAQAVFESLVAGGFLGPDVQLVHFSNASSADIRRAAALGASLALTPITELRMGYGLTALRDYLEGGLRVGLGVDSSSLAGSANMFAVMKLLQLTESGRLERESAMSARQLLRLATIESARSLGLEAEIGSITAGKRADLVMVTTRALNMGMLAGDPAHLIVESAQPANVDTVIVNGRIVKRHGEMTELDVAEVLRGAENSIAAILERAR